MRNLLAKLFLFAAIAAPLMAHGQDAAGMTGVVTDASGAVLPGTAVVLIDTARGAKLTTQTRSDGSYRFQNVPPASSYAVTFTHSGFSDVKIDNVALQVGITRTQDAKLLAGSTEQVEVNAKNEAVTINTTDATIGNNLDVKLLNDLPVQDRASGITNLFTLQPGYADGSFTGARTDQSSVTLDGMDTNNVANGANLAIVGSAPIDSVQEFRGTVGGLVSSQGTGSGGQFQLVTKSGTNNFHGNLNEYHRDASTVANSWFNNNNGLARPNYIRNQFGGNLGGPILKDKIFFFLDYNNSRIVTSSSQIRTVPTPSFLAGNVSYINSNAGCNGNSRINTTPTCISVLPNTSATGQSVTSLDPLHLGFSQPLLQLLNTRFGNLSGGTYDLTGGDGVNTEYYRFNSPTPSTAYNGVARLDFQLSQKQRIFVRFTNTRTDAIQSTPEIPTDPLTSPYSDRSYGYVINHTWQIGTNKVNQAYFGDTIDKENFDNTFNPAGTTSLSLSKYIGGFTSAPYAGASVQERRIPVPEVRDDFSWQLGKHNVQFGGTFKFIKTNSLLVNDFNFVTVGLSPYTSLSRAQAPTNAYFGSTTAVYDYFGAFNVALGSIAEADSNFNYDQQGNGTQQGTGTHRHYRFYQTELYFGDTWKVSPKLTVDYGLRYQLYTVPYETTGFQSKQQISYQDYLNDRVAQSSAGNSGNTTLPLSTYVRAGKANNGPTEYNPSYKDFAPRVAFAYTPNGKMVINASAGLVFDRTVINAVNFIQDQNSELFQQTLSTPFTNGYGNPRLGPIPAGGAVPTFSNPNVQGNIPQPYTPNVDNTGNVNGTIGYPSGLANNSFTENIDQNLRDPYSITYNAGVQQELPGHFIFKLNYVGRLGRRLLAQVDGSQLIDFTDKTSGTTLGSAITNLEQQVRAGATVATVKPIPFFENVLGSGGTYSGRDYGFASNTAFIVNYFGSLLQKGDFADTVQGFAAYGTLPANVGLASQFAGDTYVTNGGFSSYNGLLFSLTKNLSQGLQFDFNYTWSHSIDNTSEVANFIASGSGFGFICDALRPRECRGNSDFDVTNEVNGDFLYQLPFGRGKRFASQVPHALDELIGGWSVSGLPSYRGGFALSTSTTSYVAGYANNAPAILVGQLGDLQSKPHKASNGTVLGFTGCGSANCGNLTSDYAYPTGFTIGSRNALRGPAGYFFDAGLAKDFAIIPDRVALRFRADFFNVLNHPVFNAPSTDISQASAAFGTITSTASTARVGQFALRLEF